jgi:hypothetical protein
MSRSEDDPASADPHAWRAADADGKPLAVFVGDGSVWVRVGGELARLDAATARHLGGRLMGAGQRKLR